MTVSDTYCFLTQSICTLIFNLSGWPHIFLGSGTYKKYKVASTLFFSDFGPYFFCLYNLQFKREGIRLLLLFLNNKKSPDPSFCTLFFTPHISDSIFFQGHKPTHVFKSRICSGCRLTGRVSISKVSSETVESKSLTIYNIIRWFAGPMGQTTRRPSVWRYKFFFS